MLATPTRTSQLPGTAAWVLAAALLLSLLCLGGVVRSALAPMPAQASRPAAPAPAKMLPSSWRPPTP